MPRVSQGHRVRTHEIDRARWAGRRWVRLAQEPVRTADWTAALIGLLLALTGCTGDDESAKNAGKKPDASPHMVTVHSAEQSPVAAQYERPGSLRFRRLVRIHSQEEGRITELNVFEGDLVAKDALLVQIEDDLLGAQLDKVRATKEQKKLDLERQEGLRQKRAVSEDELAQARTALAVAQAEERLLETRLAFTRIRAPFAGIITRRLVEPGDFVAKNSHLLTLADPASLIAEVYASELVLPQVKLGDSVALRIDALGAQRFEGKVLRIHPALSKTSRQAIVEVSMDPIPDGAREGQFVRARLSSTAVERLLVPFRAVDLSFAYGTDVDQALRDASSRLDRAKRFLPDSIDPPVIYKRDPFQIPVAEYVVSSPLLDPVELRAWVDYSLSRALLNLDGVAAAEVGGGLEREVRVIADQYRLAGLDLDVLDIESILRQANQDVPAGRLRMSDGEISGRTQGRFTSVEEILDLPLPAEGREDPDHRQRHPHRRAGHLHSDGRLLMAAFGLTFNIMTLGGLALGVGMLVDSTIVMLENLYRHQRRGEPPDQAADRASHEVTGAIVASTSTNRRRCCPSCSSADSSGCCSVSSSSPSPPPSSLPCWWP